jgi:hypothetical protein
MGKNRVVSTERRALFVVVSLCFGVVAGVGVAALMITTGVSTAVGVVAGGGAFGGTTSLAIQVFRALALL